MIKTNLKQSKERPIWLRLIIIILLVSGLSSSAIAQTSSIKGRIIDSRTNEKLMFVNCVLTDSKNNTKQIDGVAADTNGVFVFKNIKKKEMVLSISFVGYKRKDIEIKASMLKDNILDLGDIAIEQTSEGLQEVEIIAVKDRIKLDADKMTMNIDKNTASSVTNAFELLKKAPGISIDNDDNLKLNGKGGVLIQFQGRDMKLPWKSLVQILKGIPSAQIDKFELITNPSAKYDAEGVAGIINILFKQEKTNGWNASLGTNLYYSDVLSLMGDVNLNYVDDKFTSTLSFSTTNWSQNMINESVKKTGFGRDTIKFTDRSEMDWRSQNYNLNIGTDYKINKNNNIGLYFTYSNNKTPNINYPTSSIVSLLGPSFYFDSLRFLSQNRMYNNSDNVLINTNYQHKFDTLGQSLTLNFDFVSNNGKDESEANTKYYNLLTNTIDPYKVESIENSTISSYYSYNLRGDYFKPFSESFSLEAGFKFAYTKVDNDFLSILNEVNDISRSNNFIFDENINALYTSLNKTLNKKTSVRLGLRAENTNLKGHQIKNNTIFTQSYNSLFPNLSISHSFTDKNTLNFAYNMRISRPSYNNLNPFKLWLNDYTYSMGNTDLKPQYTHNLSLQHSFMYVLFTNLTYSYTKDVVSEIPFTANNGLITYTMPANIQNSHNVNLSVSTSIPIKPWLTVVAYLSENYSNSNSQTEQFKFENESFSFMGYSSISFTLPKKYRLDVSGYYTSGGTWGIYNYESFRGININANKSFFNDKLTISAGINNLFAKEAYSSSYNYENTVWNQSTKANFRMYSLGIKFNFGQNVKAKLNKKDDKFDERTTGKKSNTNIQGGIGM
ncbi:MAG: TonB-dependent receptor [Bacteroidales bacterium]|nr:TonB-dependent receptor [Bacteroidales bacterium]